MILSLKKNTCIKMEVEKGTLGGQLVQPSAQSRTDLEIKLCSLYLQGFPRHKKKHFLRNVLPKE